MVQVSTFIQALPKCELHVHLEGTLEPELKFALAERNGIALPYADVEEMQASYGFHDLSSFLTMYYEGGIVLLEEQDYFDLCYAYLEKVAGQNVLYTEMFFDPQQHTARGVAFAKIVNGITRARQMAESQFGIKSQLIMCIMRETGEEEALATLAEAMPFRAAIVGIGLDSEERGNPPGKFARFFAQARSAGFRLTAHCDVDQENSGASIRDVLTGISTDRIDHGINVMDDPELVRIARERGIAFTLCPYPNEIFRPGYGQDAIGAMLRSGLKITINSDDPAYMDGTYINEAFEMAQRLGGISNRDMLAISRNAFDAAWIDGELRATLLAKLEAFGAQNPELVAA